MTKIWIFLASCMASSVLADIRLSCQCVKIYNEEEVGPCGEFMPHLWEARAFEDGSGSSWLELVNPNRRRFFKTKIYRPRAGHNLMRFYDLKPDPEAESTEYWEMPEPLYRGVNASGELRLISQGEGRYEAEYLCHRVAMDG